MNYFASIFYLIYLTNPSTNSLNKKIENVDWLINSSNLYIYHKYTRGNKFNNKMFFMNIIVFFAMVVSQVMSLELKSKNVIVYPKQSFSVPKDTFAVSILESGHLKLLDSDRFTELTNLISQSLDLNGTQFKSLRWKCVITKSFGQLDIVTLVAKIFEESVGFVVDSASIYQPYHTPQECKTSCARSGKRKFGVAGPRKKKCHTHCESRGLTGQEITFVQNELLKSVPDVMKKFTEYHDENESTIKTEF
jgi:hypothetical protein